MKNNTTTNKTNKVNKPINSSSRRSANQNKRVRSFFIRSYIPFDELCKFLRSAHWVQHYALVCHDKDKWTAEDEKINLDHKEGSPKQKHSHIILYTFDAKSSSSVEKLFDRLALSLNSENPESTRVEIPTSVTSAYRYLRHLDDPHKYQYHENELVADDKVYWVKHDITDGLIGAENQGYAMVEDILNGISERELNIRYGKEYIYHSQHLRASADRIRYEENHFDVTPALIDYLLDISPYYKQDIIKFKVIFAYLKQCCSKDMDNENAFNLFISKELNNDKI